MGAYPQGEDAGPYGLPFLCQNVPRFIFTSLVLMSPTSVLMLVIWGAKIVMLLNLKFCKTMSKATCRSRVISYSSNIYYEVSLVVLQSNA